MKVYEAFVEGAKEGFNVAVRIIPFLVAILAAAGAFRGAGAMDALAKVLAPITDPLGLPAEVLPMALVRPLSGSGSLGLLGNIFATPGLGPDSYAGKLGSILQDRPRPPSMCCRSTAARSGSCATATPSLPACSRTSPG